MATERMIEEKAERINERLLTGKISINEVRKEYGLAPIKNGDDRIIALSEIQQEHVQEALQHKS